MPVTFSACCSLSMLSRFMFRHSNMRTGKRFEITDIKKERKHPDHLDLDIISIHNEVKHVPCNPTGK